MPLCLSVTQHQSHSQKPPVHLASSTSNVHILDALKITKSHKISKFNLTNMDFENIVMKEVKYLPFAFNDDVLYFATC